MQEPNEIVPSHTGTHKAIIQALGEIIKEAIDAYPRLPVVESVITLSTAPSQLHKNKHKYSLLFMTEATTFNFDIPGIGRIPLTLGIGWNERSAPDGTETASGEDSLSALDQYSDTLE